MRIRFPLSVLRTRIPVFAFVSGSLGLSIFGFQNCANNGFQTLASESLNSGTSYCLTHPTDLACTSPSSTPTCSFNGSAIKEGQSLTAYVNSSVPTGQACAPQIRTCHDGVLSGSAAYASCDVAASQMCLFNGQSVADGAIVVAYLSAGGANQACQPQNRVCTDGQLSGSYSFASCQTTTAVSCLFNGQTVPHGSSVTAFVAHTVLSGQTCQALTRTCLNGTLSGQGDYASCTTVDNNKSCLFNGSSIANGQSVNAYATSTVPFDQTCASTTRVCQNGILSASGEFASCEIAKPSACTLNGVTIVSGGNVTLYKQAQAGDDGLCPTETRVCSNGVLSGSAIFNSCIVPDKAVCGADVVDRPNVDASTALATCFAKNVSLYELVPGRYYVNNQVEFSNKTNVTIRTQNLASGPACLDAGASACAIITGMPTYNGSIWNSVNLSHVNFEHFAIDGNIGPRRNVHPNMDWGALGAYNSRVHCDGCTFHGFASVRSPHGTGMEYEGDNATFDTVLFRDNGWGGPNDPARGVQPNGAAGNSPWSDGLTIWSSNNLRIVNSIFKDNSDVNLIIGNGQNSVIEKNQIGNSANYSFAAVMFDNFNGFKAGNFTGSVFRNNAVDCGNGMCGIGIMVGPHYWYPSNPVTGAKVIGNSVIGARQGIFTAGVTGAEISGNTVNVFGLYVTPGTTATCATSFISTTAGDTVNVHDNSQPATASQLGACGPESTFSLLSNFGGTSFEISQLYRDVLGRDPDLDGGRMFSAALNGGTSLAALRVQMLSSDEFKNSLDGLYRKVFARPVDDAGLMNWRNFVSAGGKFIDIYVKLRLSPEGLTHVTAID